MDMNIPQALLNIPAVDLPLSPRPVANLPEHGPSEYFFSEQLSAFFDQELRAMWLRWKPAPRPNFNPELLRDLNRYCRFLTQTQGRIDCNGDSSPVEYAILASRAKGVFNLGGDLSLFMRLIEGQDRDGLLRYGKACIDVLYQNYIGHGLPITTISLVQGECLGGGFEAALSSDVLIAERQARFGFPEILFNMFPGMGAYSFLERRVGRKTTEELISGGRVYSADDMLALGVVDRVVDEGQGEAEIASFIKSRSRNRNGLAGLAAARRCVHKLDYQELSDVVEAWVDTALRLTTRDLKLMQRLVTRQTELNAGRSLH
ncbi:MAG TPA: crotonase/enoyl-CoA hydratase family protein [Burkholderiales bacterium]|nr:crotonase/enoyl-CoA hydratase family protein [Burkholderiales bacterium]